MRSRMRLIATVLTLSVGFSAGCVGDSTFDISRDTTSHSSAKGGRQSIWGRGDNSVASTMPSSSASPIESMSKAFRQVSASVSGVFETQPSTTSATDPSQLSSRPEKLSPGLYVRAAAWSEDQGDVGKARKQYEQALALDPQNVKTLVAFARFHDRQGQDNEALQRYRQANSLTPNNVLVLNDVGLFQARRRNFAPAVESLQQTVQLAPQNVRYRNNLAGVLVQAGRPDEAVAVLRAVHSEAVANLNVGHFLSMEKNLTDATAYFRQAAQLDPSLVTAREMLGQVDEAVAANPRVDPYVAQTIAAGPNASAYSNPYRPVAASQSMGWENSSPYGSDRPQPPTRPQVAPQDGPRRLPRVL